MPHLTALRRYTVGLSSRGGVMQCAVQWLEWKFHFNQLGWNIMMFYGAGEPRKPAYPEEASGVQLKLTHPRPVHRIS